MIVLSIPTVNPWPTGKELSLRDEIERELVRHDIHVDGHDCGAGSMSISVDDDSDRAVAVLAHVVEERDLDADIITSRTSRSWLLMRRAWRAARRWITS